MNHYVRQLLVGAILTSLLGHPRVSHASGSVDLVLAERRCTVSIRQTFRKSLPPGMKGYATRVRKRFAARLAPMMPAIDKTVGKYRRAGTTDFSFAMPVSHCKTASCTKHLGASFPRLLVLPAMRFSDDARREYRVGIPFARKPKARQLSRLHGRLFKLIKKRDGDELGDIGDTAAQPIAAQQLKTKQFQLRLSPNLWARTPHHQRHTKALKALLGQCAAKVGKLLAQKRNDVSVAPWNDKLPYYEDSKKLPGKVSSSKWGDWMHSLVVYAVDKLTSKDAYKQLNRSVYDLLP